jgi:PAS domain S-box-containing protein
LVSLIKNAQIGRRGYLVTGEESSLEPYNKATTEIDQKIKNLRKLIADNPNQQRRLDVLTSLITNKLALIKESIDLRKNQGLDIAVQKVLTDKLEGVMEDIQKTIIEMNNEEDRLLLQRSEQVKGTAQGMIFGILVGSFLAAGFLASAIFAIYRDFMEHKSMEKKINQQNTYLTALHETTLDLVNRLDLPDLLKAIVSKAGELIGASHGFVHLTEPERTETIVKAGIGIFEEHIGVPVKLGEGLIGRVWQTGQPVVVKDYSSWPDRLPNPVFDSLCAVVGIPLKIDSQILGIFGLAYVEKDRTFGSEEIALLNQFARLASIALYNAQLYIAVQQELVGRKRLEEQFRNLLELAPQAIVVIDESGKILLINSETEKLFGYTREELLMQPVEILMPDRFRDKHPKHRTNYFVDPKIRPMGMGLELYGRRKDGSEFSLEIGLSPLLTETDTWVIAAIQDITDRREREKQLREAKRAAEDANQAKSQFLAAMSHELRTPLNAIIGFSEILVDQTFGPLNDKQSRQVNNILTSGRHLLQLINDILDIAKIEAGHMQLDLSQFDVGTTLRDIQAIVKTLANKKNITLTIEVESSIPRVTGDQSKFKQILHNLLSNAIKFTHEGGKVTVRAMVEKKGGALPSDVKISVIDSGIGIKAEDQERIFMEFEQVDSSYARKQQGTGLGLALTRKLVELHGGRVWVESEGEGRGSTFSFQIPIVQPEVMRTEGVTEVKSWTPTTKLRPLALVVEDNLSMGELLHKFVGEAGYYVVSAVNGEQAIDMAQKLKPDVITLDIILSDKHGLEILAELKDRPETQNIPVVVVSITRDRQLGFSLGAAEWLVKPINRDRLGEVLKKIKGGIEIRIPTVLIVDDDPTTVELLTDVAEVEGFQVLQGHGGQEGINLARERLPNLIILDLMMPEVNGFDVVRELQEHEGTREIPILIFTAKDLTEGDRQELNRYVRKIVSKSSKEELLQGLEKVRNQQWG